MSCVRTSVGVALTEQDMRYCSELIGKIISEKMEEIIAAALAGRSYTTITSR